VVMKQIGLLAKGFGKVATQFMSVALAEVYFWEG